MEGLPIDALQLLVDSAASFIQKRTAYLMLQKYFKDPVQNNAEVQTDIMCEDPNNVARRTAKLRIKELVAETKKLQTDVDRIKE